MATQLSVPFEVAQTISGNSPETRLISEGASLTFSLGDVLNLDANGRTQAAGANPTAIAGIAASAGANNATAGAATTSVYVANYDTVFKGNLKGTADADRVGALSDVGTLYGIARVTGTPNRWYVNAGDTTAVRVRVIAFLDPVTDTNPRVLFKFINENGSTTMNILILQG